MKKSIKITEGWQGGHYNLNAKFPEFYRFSRGKSHTFSWSSRKAFRVQKKQKNFLLVAIYLITIAEQAPIKSITIDNIALSDLIYKSFAYLSNHNLFLIFPDEK